MQQVFDALWEPNRRAILGALTNGERSVGELEERLGLSQPAISKHLRVLRNAGMVEVRTDAQWRMYRLRHEHLIALDEWLDPYRRLWSKSLDALEQHLDRMPDKPAKKGRRRK
jgi:DNA-binding transcriptional ArsR family regulator